MLTALRSFISGWTAKILFLLLVGSFALWGTADHGGHGAGSGYTVAEVGGTTVTATQYLSSYNQSLNAMQQRFGRRFTQVHLAEHVSMMRCAMRGCVKQISSICRTQPLFANK